MFGDDEEEPEEEEEEEEEEAPVRIRGEYRGVHSRTRNFR